MADTNITGQEAFKEASGALDKGVIEQASKVVQAEEKPVVESAPVEKEETKQAPIVEPENVEDFPTGQFTPVPKTMPYTDRVNMAIESGQVEYPKFRTLSQEEQVSYEKLINTPEYQQIAEKSYQVASGKKSTKAMALAVGEILTKERNELWFGNLPYNDTSMPELRELVMSSEEFQDVLKRAGSEDLMIPEADYDFISRIYDQIQRDRAGDFTFAQTRVAVGEILSALSSPDVKEAGKGATALAGGIAGATLGAKAGALAGSALPVGGTIAGSALGAVGGFVGGSLGVVGGAKGFEAVFGETQIEEFANQRNAVKEKLKNNEITPEQAEQELVDIRKAETEYRLSLGEDNTVQTIGKELIRAGMDKLQQNLNEFPALSDEEQDSFVRRMTSGVDSMGEYLTGGVVGRTIGKALASRRFHTRKDINENPELFERYANQVGGKIGSDTARTQMFLDVMGSQAVEDINAYIEQTGDTELAYYQGDLGKVFLNLGVAYVNDIIEQKWGVNKFIQNPRLVSKYGEWANGFVQEFTQGEVQSIVDFAKGNQNYQELLSGVWDNVMDGVVGAITQGALGTGVYAYNHRQAVNQLADLVKSAAPNKTTKEVRDFAEKTVKSIEEGVMKDTVQEIVDFSDLTAEQGALYEKIRSDIKASIDYQRQAMKDTLDGSKFDEMSENELAQYINSVAKDEIDKIVIDSLERKIPLSEHVRQKGEVIDGTYFLEGSDYAIRTKKEAEKTAKQIRDMVYAQKQALQDAKAEVKERNVSVKSQDDITVEELEIRGSLQDALTKAAYQISIPEMSRWFEINYRLGYVMMDAGEDDLAFFSLSDYEKSNKNFALWAKDKLLELYNTPETDTETSGELFAKKYTFEKATKDNKTYQEGQSMLFQQASDLAEENARLDDIYPEYTGETIEINGVERTVYNSNGDRIAKSAEALRNFYNWFGDSKVVDEQGRPLVVYHGSEAIFDTFDNTQDKTKTRQIGAELGYFFTDKKSVAEKFRTQQQRKAESKYYKENTAITPVEEKKYDKDGNYLGSVVRPKAQLPEYRNFGLYEVYLKAENVVEYNGEMIGVGEERATALQSAKLSGKDGVIIYNADTGAGIANEYIVFEPNQIKSVDNRGTFSADTGNIYFQLQNQSGKGGAYDARTRSITLGAKADATTFPHEFAHYWIDKNFKWARSGKASVAWLEQWNAVEKWLGIDPEDKVLDRTASEKFARAYERFLGEESVPLVLTKSLGDFRDFVLDHYDYDLDEAKGLQDKYGRPIQLSEDVKDWFRKSVYENYKSPEESLVIANRLAKEEQESRIGAEIANSETKVNETAVETLPDTVESKEEIRETNKRTIGTGEEVESKGAIGSALGKTYKKATWEQQEELVADYLSKTSLDDAIDSLDTDTYPDGMDANFLRMGIADKLIEQGRELEAAALIEEASESFTMAGQQLQAARRINTPFVNYINLLSIKKAEKLAKAKFGNKKDSLAKLDSIIEEIVNKYQDQFMSAKNDEERTVVLSAMQSEAVRTIGSLDPGMKLDLSFQDAEERKQVKEIKQKQKRRASIPAYRAKAKRLLKEALGLTPSREQVRQIKKLSAKVQKKINEYRKAVRENKASAIDPTAVLLEMNVLNNYLNDQIGESTFSKMADATNSFMMANMLWNPATNIFNIESTLVQMMPHLIANYIDNGLGVISVSEKANLIKKALEIQIKTGYNIFSLRDYMSDKTLWAEKYYEAQSTTGKFVRAPLTLLGLSDTMMKGTVFLSYADSLAHKQAKSEGKEKGWKKEQITERAKSLFYQALNTDPRTITVDGLKIREKAVVEGEEATFTNKTKTAELANKFRQLLNLNQKTGVGNLLIPFTTTVANIVEDAIANYTAGAFRKALLNPKSFLKSINPFLDKEMRKEAWKDVKPETKNVIKNMIGALILLSIALSYTDDDEYVLDYNVNSEIDKDMRENRNAPYTASVRIGNKWVSLDMFGIGTPLAKIYLTARRFNFTTDGWVKGVASLRDMIPGISEIEGIYTSLTKTAQYEGESGALKELGLDQISELSTRLIPMSALLNQIGNIEDDTKRESWNNWYDRAISRIPVLRRRLPERLSFRTGKPIKQTDSIGNLATGSRIKDYVESTPADKARYEFVMADKALVFREKSSRLKYLGTDTREFKKAVAEVRRIFTDNLNKTASTAKYQALDIDSKREVAKNIHKKSLDYVVKKYGLDKRKK